jgi:threonine synthase
MKGVVATSSPSMDIQISSNFERYLFEASGRNARLIRTFMSNLAHKGRFDLGPLWPVLKGDFAASAASEGEVAACIKDTDQRYGYLLDPHTACGVVAADKIKPGGDVVVLATAHPAKFPEALERITGSRPPLPSRLAHLLTDEERFTRLGNDLAAVESFVEGAARPVARHAL